MTRQRLTTDDLLFVSFTKKVFAVDRLDGTIVWKWTASKSMGVVTLLPSGDRLFVSVNGYTWALDPATGAELWYQEFKGEGLGVAMLATMGDGATDPMVTTGVSSGGSGDGVDGGGADGGGGVTDAAEAARVTLRWMWTLSAGRSRLRRVVRLHRARRRWSRARG
jgi:outer membrane protein assembly factor BamB